MESPLPIPKLRLRICVVWVKNPVPPKRNGARNSIHKHMQEYISGRRDRVLSWPSEVWNGRSEQIPFDKSPAKRYARPTHFAHHPWGDLHCPAFRAFLLRLWRFYVAVDPLSVPTSSRLPATRRRRRNGRRKSGLEWGVTVTVEARNVKETC